MGLVDHHRHHRRHRRAAAAAAQHAAASTTTTHHHPPPHSTGIIEKIAPGICKTVPSGCDDFLEIIVGPARNLNKVRQRRQVASTLLDVLHRTRRCLVVTRVAFLRPRCASTCSLLAVVEVGVVSALVTRLHSPAQPY
jgi:hypothetical protein